MKTIPCPRCGGSMSLDDHEITEHEDGTWSADTSVICPHDCGAQFFITHGQVELVSNQQ
jgi:phage terminase large subunit GpA-like protein